MQQTIKSGRRHDGIGGEYITPLGEGLVAGEDDRLFALIALADDLEQQRGLRAIQREISDFVDDQKLGANEIVDLAREMNSPSSLW